MNDSDLGGQMRIFKITLVTVVALVAAAALALGVVNNITLTHKITALHRTVAAQQVQLGAADHQLSSDGVTLSSLQPLEQYANGDWYSVQGTDAFGNYNGQTYYMPATTVQP